MNVKEKNAPFTGFVNAPSGDQHFLLNFIMSTFLGPDLYSDNPRRSAAHRLAKGLPPYTSNNLGDSFLHISQLESLYYYVLRNARPGLVLNPNTLCLYLEGKLHLSGSDSLEDCRQFTSFFPLGIHGHKKDSASQEIVKGIVLIENPDTSYIKEDLEKFKCLSGMDSLKIDMKKCLSYGHESQKGGEETEQFCMPKSDEKIAGTISARNERPPAMFQHTYKRRRRCSLSVSAFHCGVSHSQGHSEESNTFGRSCRLDGPPRVDFPKFKDYFTEKSVIYDRFVNAPSGDQHFLLNFIMSTFLGPDLYSDNPRRSAAHRLAKGLPPYTSNNLGDSFLHISQLESLYYYVLRNARPGLVLNPNTLCLYLEGKLHLSGSDSLEDCRQFTSFFPLGIHGHKKDSASQEIVKGIVLIENPDTSYIKEDLEKFKCLSGMDSLKIDMKKCLSYGHESQKGGEETEQFCMPKSDEKIAGTISARNERPPAMFQHTYKRRRRCSLSVSAFHCGVSHSQGHSEESNTFGRSCRLDGPPRVDFPKFKDYFTEKSVILTGTARRELRGPPIGIVDMGISKAAYFFQVALPGVRSDSCEFSCEIESDGKVHIQGSTSGGEIIKKRSRVFHMKFQQMWPPGPFTVSFNLPGPVDPRLVSPKFRTDGIFEAVVMKQK